MATTNAFKVAELIRHLEYDSSNDVITTSKRMADKNKKRADTSRSSNSVFSLDTFAHASFAAARYIVAMTQGTKYHSTEIMLIHDGTNVTITLYGTLKSESLASFTADISGSDVRLRCTPASGTATNIQYDRTLVDA
jgi:hypothetical protein